APARRAGAGARRHDRATARMGAARQHRAEPAPRRDPRRRRQLLPARRHRLARDRSEEHTSELQSRENLVCRLLLEKKKHNTTQHGKAREPHIAPRNTEDKKPPFTRESDWVPEP